MQAARALEGYEECLLQCIAIASSLYADAQDDDAEEVRHKSTRAHAYLRVSLLASLLTGQQASQRISACLCLGS